MGLLRLAFQENSRQKALHAVGFRLVLVSYIYTTYYEHRLGDDLTAKTNTSLSALPITKLGDGSWMCWDGRHAAPAAGGSLIHSLGLSVYVHISP